MPSPSLCTTLHFSVHPLSSYCTKHRLSCNSCTRRKPKLVICMLLFRIQCALSVSVEVFIAGIFHNSDCWKLPKKHIFVTKLSWRTISVAPGLRTLQAARVHQKTPTTTLAGFARADMPSDLTQYLKQVMYFFVQLGFMHKNCR